MAGLLGRKLGMTQVFSPDGNVVPVTVIEAGPCVVLEVLTEKSALKIGFGDIKENRVRKPQQGYFKKIELSPRRYIRDLKFEDLSDYQPGSEIKADLFQPGDYVDVTGTSKGRGFAGMIKRWGAKSFPSSHGHPMQRQAGSQGCSATPARVFRGKKLPGRYGGAKKTVQNLEVVQVRPDENLIMLRGAVPGSRSGLLLIRKALKKKRK
ncbi:MAG TPA: 50S ribosomal protein L3 [Proteobacteria bacterium]|nr:50S ribosomal protein L3 [Pseudomonadota bacterium]